jgi:hypothetical protein
MTTFSFFAKSAMSGTWPLRDGANLTAAMARAVIDNVFNCVSLLFIPHQVPVSQTNINAAAEQIVGTSPCCLI